MLRLHHWANFAGFVLFVGILAVRAAADIFPKGTNVTSLTVINEDQLGSPAQRVMIATLQGIVARRSGSQIYINVGSPGYGIWYHHLKNFYGIPFTTTSNPWALVNQFKTNVNGYVLYDASANSNSLNAATSLCGPFNAIAVDASIEVTVRSYGITNRLADVRTRNEAWVWTNYSATLSRSVLVEQKETISNNLRDYAAMTGAFTFFDGNSPFCNFVMSQMPADTPCLGTWDSSQGEDVAVRISSSNGVYMVGSDWALNLSTLSGMRDSTIYQRAYAAATPVLETNVHYVTFMTTDGDNVQWNLGDMAGYFNHPARGSLNMGWTISPTLADLAPSVLRWYYDNSSNGPNRDVFVAGTSGIGYFYPSMYPPAALDTHVQKLNEFMDHADLDLVNVNDFGSFGRLDLWNKYLAQPNIAGLFYVEYTLYSALGGAVLFSANGRPIISARNLLWGGVEEATNVIAKINSYPRDSSSAAGYTLVQVHVWSRNLSDVQNVVTNLAPDVRVVTPDVFVRLVRNNVGRKLSFDFSSSLQGWIGGTSGGATDKASWTNVVGNPPGALLLDGSDIGSPDTNRNSFFWRQIILPPNSTMLRFDTRAENDGLLRTRLVADNGTVATLLDWERLSTTNTWVTRSASLTNHAGQTVIVFFEQNDGGQHTAETRYVDNIQVLTDGPPLYFPDAPKLLAVAATNHASLLWRDNAENESGLTIERSTGTNDAWAEIGTVSSNATAYTDMAVSSGTNYSYRVRSWNAAGFSAYSNVRTVTTRPRPSLFAVPMGSSLKLSWPAWASNFSLRSATNISSIGTWASVSEAPTNFNGEINAIVPCSSAVRFFRLESE